MTSCWIGVASLDHVVAAVRGGFVQLGHGKHAPVRRLQRRDLIAYYSPRERLDEGSPAVRAFTAIGRIQDDDPFEVKQGEDFHSFRRKAEFLKADRAPIAELLDKLSFTRGKRSWGVAFRQSLLKVSEADFCVIARAMGASLTNCR